MRTLPKDFFTNRKPNIRDKKSIVKNHDDEIIPFKWSKEVWEGKRKVVADLPQKKCSWR